MPVIKVEMFEGRTLEQKRQFASEVTKSFCSVCGGEPKSVHVVFTEYSPTDWAVGGELVSSILSKNE